MAKLSVQHIVLGFNKVWRRFPLTTLSAFFLTLFLTLVLTKNNYVSADVHLNSKISVALFHCLLLSIAGQLYAEKHRFTALANSIQMLVTAALCLLWYWQSYDMPDVNYVWTNIVLSCCLHLLVAVAAFDKTQNNYAFWQFNRFIFLRILLSFLYSGVLFIGIALALLGIDYLLHIDVDGDVFSTVWATISVFFTTCFFLAGMPSISEIETPLEEPFPKGLRVFTANVLLPLVVVYLVILYFYSLRLFTSGSWQAPWTAYFVSLAAVFGILSLLLLHPLIVSNENKLLRRVFVTFFYALLPLLVLLLASVSKQVISYGITESRYMRLLIGLWLLWLSISFSLKPENNLRKIPLSLLVIGLLSIFGPWSLQSLSIWSQKNRLATVLAEQGISINGTVPASPKTKILDAAVKTNISGIIDYLMKRCEPSDLQALFDAPLKTMARSNSWQKAEYINSLLALKEEKTNNHVNGINSMSADEEAIDSRLYRLKTSDAINIAGYEHLIEIELSNVATNAKTFEIEKQVYQFFYSSKQAAFVFTNNSDSLLFPTTTRYATLWQKSTSIKDVSLMTLNAKGNKIEGKLVISAIDLNKVIDISASTLRAKLFLKTSPK